MARDEAHNKIFFHDEEVSPQGMTRRILSWMLVVLSAIGLAVVVGFYATALYAEKPIAFSYFGEQGREFCLAVMYPKEGDRFDECGPDWRSHRRQEVGPNWRVPRQ